MTKILLTGSAGFIGSHLARHLINHTDWQIVGLDRLDFAGDLSRHSGLDPRRFGFAWHDLRSPILGHTTRQILTGQGKFDAEPFDLVAHVAAGSHVDRSVQNPIEFFQDNVLGTVHLLEWLRGGALKSKGVTLYFSTDEVFGPADKEAFTPWARMNPLNPYAAAKAGGELVCPAYVNCYGMQIIVTHGTNFFGPLQDSEKFIPIAVNRIMAGEPVDIHTVGREPCSRYYTYVENAADAVLHLLRRGTYIEPDDVTKGRYNISGEREVSNVELVESVGRLLGKKPLFRFIENPPTRVRPDLRYRVCGDALAESGWKQPVCFEEGLRRTVEAIIARPDSQSIPDLLDSLPHGQSENDNRSREHG